MINITLSDMETFSTSVSKGKHVFRFPVQFVPTLVIVNIDGSTGGCGSGHLPDHASTTYENGVVTVTVLIHDNQATLTAVFGA